jgi:hypothetical protein
MMFNSKQRKCFFKYKKKKRTKPVSKKRLKSWKTKYDRLRRNFKNQSRRLKHKLSKTFTLEIRIMMLLLERHSN